MYQSKEEAIKALTDVKAEIETTLDTWEWLEEKAHDEYLEEMQSVAEEMEWMQSELCGAIMQLEASSREYLGQHRRNYVALTVIEARELNSKFNILKEANALY